MRRFALIGVGGYIAPRHLKAIRDTGCELAAGTDPFDSVGILDSYFPQARFFTEIERFDRHLEKLRRKGPEKKVDYVSVCSPNYLHDAHIRLALRLKAHAICEKPLVINPWNLDALGELEAEHEHRIFTILQLRKHPAIVALKKRVESEPDRRYDIELSYVTRRGRWYFQSWKGSEEKSGGLAMNIGVHFFDMLSWVFGKVEHCEVHLRDPNRFSGALELERARVKWFLSVDEKDLPAQSIEQGQSAHRSLTLDGEAIDFSGGFTDLHTEVYRDILDGNGPGITEARAGIELVYRIRSGEIVKPSLGSHPQLAAV